MPQRAPFTVVIILALTVIIAGGRLSSLRRKNKTLGPRIALDAMGGDHGPSVVVPAALQVLAEEPDLHLILVGDKETITQAVSQSTSRTIERLTIHHASQIVDMNESASHALRSKKDSSMRVAINLVKNGQADACVSAGNTGALMATARYVLKTLPGIDRPAIITALPTMQAHKTHVLDLGANVTGTFVPICRDGCGLGDGGG